VTTVDLGLVETSELRRIFDILWMLRLEQSRLPGVIVYCSGGTRRWQLTTERCSFEVLGDGADFTGAYLLPVTIIANAGRHHAATGSVQFTISNDTITAHSSLGTQTLPCTTVPLPDSISPAATALPISARTFARLGGKELSQLFFSGAGTPFEANIGDDDAVQPDHCTITVGDGRISVSSDWSSANLYPVTATTPAETGGRGAINVHLDLLPVIFNCVDSDSVWTIGFDPDQPHEIHLSSDTQRIIARMAAVPAVKLHERVVKILEGEEIEFHATAASVIGVRLDGVTLSLDFFERTGDDQPLVRLSTVVTHDVNQSAALLQEINDHNKHGVLTRLWCADRAVHCAVEVAHDNLSTLVKSLRHLAGEAQRLRGVLEPLAAEAALPRRTPAPRRAPTATRRTRRPAAE
jgi:hypothetical protein